jgi:hypothetical protein
MTMRTSPRDFSGLWLAATATGLLAAPGLASAEKLSVNLIGYQETPAINSAGTADFDVWISPDQQSITWQLTYSGLANVTQAHIHIGQRSVAGAIVIFLCTNGTPPAGQTISACPTSAGTVTGTSNASNVLGVSAQGITAGDFAAVLAAIHAGVAYVNVHTMAHPGGEIRGQLMHQHHEDSDGRH